LGFLRGQHKCLSLKIIPIKHLAAALKTVSHKSKNKDRLIFNDFFLLFFFRFLKWPILRILPNRHRWMRCPKRIELSTNNVFLRSEPRWVSVKIHRQQRQRFRRFLCFRRLRYCRTWRPTKWPTTIPRSARVWRFWISRKILTWFCRKLPFTRSLESTGNLLLKKSQFVKRC